MLQAFGSVLDNSPEDRPPHPLDCVQKMHKIWGEEHPWPQPSECGRQRTLNIVHAQTDAQQQSNGSYEAWMSWKYGEWRD